MIDRQRHSSALRAMSRADQNHTSGLISIIRSFKRENPSEWQKSLWQIVPPKISTLVEVMIYPLSILMGQSLHVTKLDIPSTYCNPQLGFFEIYISRSMRM